MISRFHDVNKIEVAEVKAVGCVELRLLPLPFYIYSRGRKEPFSRHAIR